MNNLIVSSLVVDVPAPRDGEGDAQRGLLPGLREQLRARSDERLANLGPIHGKRFGLTIYRKPVVQPPPAEENSRKNRQSCFREAPVAVLEQNA